MASSLLSMTCTSAFISTSMALARSEARSAFSMRSFACSFPRSATRFFSTCSAATCSSRSLARCRSLLRASSFILAVMASAWSVAVRSCNLSSDSILSFAVASARNVSSSRCTWLLRFCESSCARSSSVARLALTRRVSSSASALAFETLSSLISFSSSVILARSFFMMVLCFCSVTPRFLPSSISWAIC